MIVIGVDPSLCNVGLAVMELRPVGERVLQTRVFRTEPSPKKRKLLVAEDNARRVSELVGGLDDAITQHRPVALVIESPAGSQHAKSASALGMAFALVVAVAKVRRLPLVQVTVNDVKLATCGRRDASKEEVIRAMEERYPGIVWPEPRGVIEHAADAVGAVVAALDGDTLRLARRLSA